MSEPVTWADLPNLLHDARLTYFAWKPAEANVSLFFNCLRRNVNGSEIADPTVRVVLSCVKTLTVAYDAACRPSEFTPPALLTAAGLQSYYCNDEPVVWLNHPHSESRFLSAIRVDWFAGTVNDLTACAYRVGLSFGHGLPYLSILLGGAQLEAFAGRKRLSLALWGAQYGAWWDGWREYWSAQRQNSNTEAKPGAEAAAIPAGVDPPLPAEYAWPEEPVVEWEPTDAPADVLQALTQWFGDEASSPRKSFGLDRRFYARQLDSWWVEGERASATVRGVEHNPPVEGHPAQNIECVQECLLRRTASGWTVQPLARSWPPYGSAPARPAREKPWLLRWKSGKVLSRRTPRP